MSLSLAIIGPGRVGCALGRRWVTGGVELLGFLGRDPAAAERACAFSGAGRPLDDMGSLAPADAVLISVGDDRLPELVAHAAAVPPRRGSLWFHCSGGHGVEVLSPLLAAGAEVGSLHPLCPVPDAETGFRLLQGRDAVVEGRSPLLDELARLAGLEPLHLPRGERAVYHAACNLAANGLTALADAAGRLFLAHGVPDRATARRLATGLMAASLEACRTLGPAEALSGPVLRGDTGTLRAHLRALQAVAPQTLPTYLSLMRHAVMLARIRGLGDEDLRAFEALLGEDPAGG